MKDFKQYFWYRYVGKPSTFLDAHPEYELELGDREIFGLYYAKDKCHLIDASEPEILFTLGGDEDVEALLNSARPYRGKVAGSDVKDGLRSIKELKEACSGSVEVPADKKPTVFKGEHKPTNQVPDSFPQPETHATGLPNKREPFDIEIMKDITKIDTHSSGTLSLFPPPEGLVELFHKASPYLGLKVLPDFKRVPICVSEAESTCMLGTRQAYKNWNNFLIINVSQLKDIFGTITFRDLGQVVTHELAHYVDLYGVVKQSDKRRFKKMTAGLRIHKEQLTHKGYNYPYFVEQWAILAEYMVWGKSCRGLCSTNGWEIVEKYFDNNFLVSGIPSGEKMIALSKVEEK